MRQEAQQWQQEGIIDPEIYQQLTSRYQLDELDSVSRDRFIIIVFGIGFVLLGLGIITFVAANWQVWTRPIKVLLLLSLFIGTSCGGFYLWQSPDGSKSPKYIKYNRVAYGLETYYMPENQRKKLTSRLENCSAIQKEIDHS